MVIYVVNKLSGRRIIIFNQKRTPELKELSHEVFSLINNWETQKESLSLIAKSGGEQAQILAISSQQALNGVETVSSSAEHLISSISQILLKI